MKRGPAPALPELPAISSLHPVPLQALKDHHCRWPLGEPHHEMLHCGDTAMPGQPYCAVHYRIAYAAPQARPRPVWLRCNPRQKAAAV